jgi:hypothetical protein
MNPGFSPFFVNLSYTSVKEKVKTNKAVQMTTQPSHSTLPNAQTIGLQVHFLPSQEIQEPKKYKQRVRMQNGYNDGAICPHGCSNTVEYLPHFLAAPLVKCQHFGLLSTLVAVLVMEMLLSNH